MATIRTNFDASARTSDSKGQNKTTSIGQVDENGYVTRKLSMGQMATIGVLAVLGVAGLIGVIFAG